MQKIIKSVEEIVAKAALLKAKAASLKVTDQIDRWESEGGAIPFYEPPKKKFKEDHGRVKKVIWLCQQSARGAVCSPQPIGYGYIETDKEEIYFQASAIQNPYTFNEVQEGQDVEYTLDKTTPNYAATVSLIGNIMTTKPVRTVLEKQ